MKILSDIKSRYKLADKDSLNKSEKLIRRRIAVEEMRFKYYDNYSSLLAFEYKSISTVMAAMVILFSIFAYQLEKPIVAIYSIPIVIILIIRKNIIRNSARRRLKIEKHKIKRVLDTIDDQDDIPLELFFWLISAKSFINETSNFGI